MTTSLEVTLSYLRGLANDHSVPTKTREAILETVLYLDSIAPEDDKEENQ